MHGIGQDNRLGKRSNHVASQKSWAHGGHGLSSQKDGLAFDQRPRGQQLETRNGVDDHASGPAVSGGSGAEMAPAPLISLVSLQRDSYY